MHPQSYIVETTEVREMCVSLRETIVYHEDLTVLVHLFIPHSPTSPCSPTLPTFFLSPFSALLLHSPTYISLVAIILLSCGSFFFPLGLLFFRASFLHSKTLAL